MKKILILLVAFSMTSCSLFQHPVFEEDFNDHATFQKNWDTRKYKAPGNIIYAAQAGIEESGCLKITSRRPTYISAKTMISGLKPGKMYRVSAMAKSKDIKFGSGASIFVAKDDNQLVWNVSKPLFNTNKEWQEIYVDFIANESGNAMICCGLGAPWDTQDNGLTMGTIWYDNLKVTKAPFGTSYDTESERQITPVAEEEIAPAEE